MCRNGGKARRKPLLLDFLPLFIPSVLSDKGFHRRGAPRRATF